MEGTAHLAKEMREVERNKTQDEKMVKVTGCGGTDRPRLAHIVRTAQHSVQTGVGRWGWQQVGIARLRSQEMGDEVWIVCYCISGGSGGGGCCTYLPGIREVGP